MNYSAHSLVSFMLYEYTNVLWDLLDLRVIQISTDMALQFQSFNASKPFCLLYFVLFVNIETVIKCLDLANVPR